MIIKIYADGEGAAFNVDPFVGSAVVRDETMLTIAQALEQMESDLTACPPLYVHDNEAEDAEALAAAFREAHGKVHGRP